MSQPDRFGFLARPEFGRLSRTGCHLHLCADAAFRSWSVCASFSSPFRIGFATGSRELSGWRAGGMVVHWSSFHGCKSEAHGVVICQGSPWWHVPFGRHITRGESSLRCGFLAPTRASLQDSAFVYYTEWSYARIAKVARSCGTHMARGVIAGWDLPGRM